MTRQSGRAWMLLAVLGGATGSVAQEGRPAAPEVARLLSESRPPARFRDHLPDFDIRAQRFTFTLGGRKQEATYFAVMDGPRFVALCDPPNSHVEVIAATPEGAPTKVDLRYPLGPDAEIGTRLKPEIRLSGRPLEIDQNDCHFSKEPGAAVLVMRQEWSAPRKGHSTSVFRFRCDPARGYTVEISTQVSLVPDSTRKTGPGDVIGVLAVKPAKLDNPWPAAGEHDRTVYTSRNTGYAGWWNNLATASRVHGRDDYLPLRPGGFLAYLGSKGTWSPAISYPDTTVGTPLHRVDPATLEQHCYLVRQPSPESAQVGPLMVQLEYTPLPPEAGAVLAEKANFSQWESQRSVMVRLGRTEDFEDQPLPLASGTRGLLSPAYILSTKEAHSGKNSMVLLGTPANRQTLIKPQVTAPAIPLEAGSRYRVSVWAKSASGTTEGLVSLAVHSGADLRDENPRRFRTPGTKTGEGWKELTLEFETGALPSFADLRFQAIGNGAVYFDDFSFTRLSK